MLRSILIVTNRAPWPLQDGGALAMHQLITGYKTQGWAVHLLTMNTHRHWVEESFLRTAYAFLDSVTIVPFDNRLRPARLARNLLLSRQPEHAERFYDREFEQTVAETVKRVQPDVVQMESLFLTSYLPAIRAISDAALVLRMHNVEHQIWRRTAVEARGAKRLYLRSLARRMKGYETWVWKQYQLLLPITPEDANAVKAVGVQTPLHPTPFGIDVSKTSLSVRTPAFDALQFYHLGAMDWLPNREGVGWFIRDVWPVIRKEVPSAHFHFGGRMLEENFSSAALEGVSNHGPVKEAAVFVEAMDILIVPLRAGGGVRIKILEAMAAGKLVISTGIGIQGIAATPCKHFLQADTPQQFAEAAHWVTSNRNAAIGMIASARALVEEVYSAERIIVGLSKRLKSLLQERR